MDAAPLEGRPCAESCLAVDKVWIRKDGAEVEIPFSELRAGDLLIVRSGSIIPADGTVAEGEAVVNQSSMTGEPLGIVRRAGASVYAGTAVEEGEITVEVTAAAGTTRIDKIIKVIEESEGRKASVQSQAEKLADSIVPYNFALAAAVYLFTRSAERAASAIMVDYSCAIKIATPLAILAAMREGVKNGVLIKGGKYIEAMAEADTAVFDKTGTLTAAEPRVAKVVPFGGRSREEVLRLAACLEEHFPHPIARAVVRKAAEEELRHEEEHGRGQIHGRPRHSVEPARRKDDHRQPPLRIRRRRHGVDGGTTGRGSGRSGALFSAVPLR